MAYERELEVACAAAKAAGEIIRERYGTALQIHYKGEVDLVSEVDMQSEALITAAIREAFPDDQIYAEENGITEGRSGRCWHIDPLDGTTNFSHAFPHFCVSIALRQGHDTLVGVLYEPLRQWCFCAVRDGGAFLNDRPIRVSTTHQLDAALLATGFPYDRRTNPDNNTAAFAHLIRFCQGIRRAGSAALDLAFVAAGWLDGYWEDRLHSWDIAAGALIVEEAGGFVTGLRGEPFDPMRGQIIAANPDVHRQMVAHLAKIPHPTCWPEARP